MKHWLLTLIKTAHVLLTSAIQTVGVARTKIAATTGSGKHLQRQQTTLQLAMPITEAITMIGLTNH